MGRRAYACARYASRVYQMDNLRPGRMEHGELDDRLGDLRTNEKGRSEAPFPYR
jgi:hypothetical protein